MPRMKLRRLLVGSLIAIILALTLGGQQVLAGEPSPAQNAIQYFQLQIFLPVVASQASFVPPIGDYGPLEGNDAFYYTVQPGDTLLSVALEFGRDLSLMPCATSPLRPEPITLQPGEVLRIPPAMALCHRAQAGEMVATVAARYHISSTAVLSEEWNGLTAVDQLLQPGRWVLIEEPSAGVTIASIAHRPTPTPTTVPWPYGSGHFVWPLKGTITQRWSLHHRAIDIAAPWGSPIVAADNGKVIRAGWNTQGYGWLVIIDHGNDYLTLYAHLSSIEVPLGAIVRRGQIIGLEGSTGNSTGPHLHFEIRDFGRLIDPLTLLPAKQ